jgi:hypothetical protein
MAAVAADFGDRQHSTLGRQAEVDISAKAADCSIDRAIASRPLEIGGHRRGRERDRPVARGRDRRVEIAGHRHVLSDHYPVTETVPVDVSNRYDRQRGVGEYQQAVGSNERRAGTAPCDETGLFAVERAEVDAFVGLGARRHREK